MRVRRRDRTYPQSCIVNFSLTSTSGGVGFCASREQRHKMSEASCLRNPRRVEHCCKVPFSSSHTSLIQCHDLSEESHHADSFVIKFSAILCGQVPPAETASISCRRLHAHGCAFLGTHDLGSAYGQESLLFHSPVDDSSLPVPALIKRTPHESTAIAVEALRDFASHAALVACCLADMSC